MDDEQPLDPNVVINDLLRQLTDLHIELAKTNAFHARQIQALQEAK